MVRFRTPEEGEVGWNDLVKGPIAFPNAELDDLVLLRADGVPTYNFGVVVDDLDMDITHVIRGDDHVNNTPRQIHIFNALKAKLAGIRARADDPRRRRRAAVEAPRRGERRCSTATRAICPKRWSTTSRGSAGRTATRRVFSKEQLVQWFDLEHVARSPAQFNPEKLAWLNQQYIKGASDARLAALVEPELRKRGAQPAAGPAA